MVEVVYLPQHPINLGYRGDPDRLILQEQHNNPRFTKPRNFLLHCGMNLGFYFGGLQGYCPNTENLRTG